MNNYKIIQASKTRTASTVLINLIHGYMAPNEGVNYPSEQCLHNHLISKTHNINVADLEKKFSNYKLLFIMSDRDNQLGNYYKNKKNILIIKFSELNEKDNYTLDDIINNTYEKLHNFLPEELKSTLDSNETKANMKNRISNMNNLYEQIKNKPFSYFDKFYHIHGKHRNRK
jgi:hypothetical protein